MNQHTAVDLPKTNGGNKIRNTFHTYAKVVKYLVYSVLLTQPK
jgi:hypothetical protein